MKRRVAGVSQSYWRLLAVMAVVTAGFAGAVWCEESGQFDYKEITLDNGLRVITLEDFSCPIISVELWYHVGSKNEDPNRQGFAHMFEHMMFRGTDQLGPTDHFDYIHKVGGDCNGYTSFDQTVYVERIPADQLELVLWLEAERMSFLKIDQAAFDTERKVVEEERRLRLNQPYGTIDEEAMAALFKVHPYQWTPIGKIPHLRASSVPELRAFWTKYYVPNNATLVLVGAVKTEDAQAMAKKYFGWIPRYPDPPTVDVREPMPTAPQRLTLEQDNAPAPLAGMVWRTAPLESPDSVPIELLSTILGKGRSSRVYRSVVAEKQLGVDAYSMNTSLEQDGILLVGAAMPPFGSKLDATLEALNVEVKRLREEPVSDRELTKARNQMLRNLVTENLYVTTKSNALGSAAVLEHDAARVNERIAAIRAVTADDLLKTAQKYLRPECAYTVDVKAKIKKPEDKHPEDETPVTGQPETDPPTPGRPGLTRPADYPTSAPYHMPAPVEPKLEHTTFTLPNGLKVVVVENHEVPYINTSLNFIAGAWTDKKPGTASMTFSMLNRGTEKRSERELADELETYAISMGGSCGIDNASIFAGCLTEQIDRAMGLMAEMALTPAFPEAEIEKLRKETITNLTVNNANPSYLARCETYRQIFGQHPYARTVQGEIDDVKALKRKDLARWWKKFARPDMASLYFAGDITQEKARALAETYFGGWKAHGKKPSVKLPPIPEPSPTRVILVDKAGDQVQIHVAQQSITRKDPGYFTSRVVSQYFGGTFGSRLNETVRVKKGYTYGIYGVFTSLSSAGIFDIGTFTKIDSAADTVQTILDEITRLQNEPPSKEELEKTKSFVVGSFPGDLETPDNIADDLWMIESQNLPEDYFKQLLNGIANTTAEDCTALAKRVDPSKLTIVVVGPAATLKDKLAKLGPVTVIEKSSSKESTKDKDQKKGN